MDVVPLIAALISLIVGAGGATFVIRLWLWLRYCRWVINLAVEHGVHLDPEEIIKASSRGPLGRADDDRKQLPPGGKSNKTDTGEDKTDSDEDESD